MKNNILEFDKCKSEKIKRDAEMEIYEQTFHLLAQRLDKQIMPLMKELGFLELTLYSDGYMEYVFNGEDE